MRLHCYHSIFSRLQHDTSIDLVINSTPIPQSLLFSAEQEMPIVEAKEMYEGYAHKLLTNSILFMLYEVGVEVVDREVVHDLVELVKQSIQNIGIFLSSTNVSLQTSSDYYASHYAFQPNRIASSLSVITSISNDYSIVATVNGAASEKQNRRIVPPTFVCDLVKHALAIDSVSKSKGNSPAIAIAICL